VIKVDAKNQIDKYLGIDGVSNKYIDVLLLSEDFFSFYQLPAIQAEHFCFDFLLLFE
jgi:hypothetical protein